MSKQIQLVSPQDNIISLEREFKQINLANRVEWESEKNFAIQQIYKNDYAVSVAQQNPVSVQNAVRNIAAIGLSLNPALKHAYLVPRDGAINLEVSYMGLMHLAQDTGSIAWGQCKIVHMNDKYINRGLSVEPTHEYQSFGDRGAIVGVYCVVKTKDGDYLTHEMDITDVYAIRERSKAFKSGKSSPWKTDEKEMIKKTCVKQASKYWPKVEVDNRLDTAIHVLNQGAEGIDFEAEQQESINYDEIAANMLAAYEMEDHAAFHQCYIGLTQEQEQKLFSGKRVNTKMREFARQANKLHWEYVAQMKYLLASDEQEDFCDNWFNHDDESVNRTMANKNLYHSLSAEDQAKAKAWIAEEAKNRNDNEKGE